MKLDNRQLEIIKNGLKDFEYIKTDINYLIEKGRNLENILDYLRDFYEIEIVHFDLDDKDFRYIDFNYGITNNSVTEDNKTGLRVQDTFVIYDEEKQEYLNEYCLSVEEWQTILERGVI